MSIEQVFFSNALFLTPILIVLVLLDNFIGIRPGLDELSQACKRLGFYLLLTIMFAYGVFYYHGTEKAGIFIAGYVLEYSLSLDNLFVFLIIVRVFDIKKHINMILNYGIIITVILRLIFIQVGVLAVEKFNFTLAIFGIILLIGAVKLLFHSGEPDINIQNSILYKTVQYIIKIDNSPSPTSLFVRKNGRFLGTKLFIAMIFVVCSDIICTIDSIPAMFGITNDMFIIYSSNVFAVLGLRSAYIVLMPLIDKFKSLEKGIIFVLCFIGIKMIISVFYPNLINVKTTLIITAAILLISCAVCFIKNTYSRL